MTLQDHRQLPGGTRHRTRGQPVCPEQGRARRLDQGAGA
jgi:hypothetical protein